MDKVSALRRTELFKELDDKSLQALAERAVIHRLSRDQVLFSGGEPARGLYVVVEGAIRAFRESMEGREQIIHVEGPGATIAEVPVFDDGPYPSTAAAEQDSIVLFIDKIDVRRICLEHPQISLAALKLLAGRLRRTAALVEALSLRGVDERLARFLLAEAKRVGVREGSGTVVELVLTNQQIAARIGSVREVVSRALNRLQQNGLVHLDGRKVIIPDESSLEAYAEEELPSKTEPRL